MRQIPALSYLEKIGSSLKLPTALPPPKQNLPEWICTLRDINLVSVMSNNDEKETHGLQNQARISDYVTDCWLCAGPQTFARSISLLRRHSSELLLGFSYPRHPHHRGGVLLCLALGGSCGGGSLAEQILSRKEKVQHALAARKSKMWQCWKTA